ncbi:hypothetical protein P8452_57993 [Trifolium repens]|nr:hypothetical protein P8452_57993 [Trifolium repens]
MFLKSPSKTISVASHIFYRTQKSRLSKGLTAQSDPFTNLALSQNLLLNQSSCDSLALTESAVSRWVCDSLLRKNGGSCGLYKGS